MSTNLLKTVYASAPDNIARIKALVVTLPTETVRLVDAYHDMQLGVEGTPVLFEACGLDIKLPDKDDSGNQTLEFALGILDDDRVNGLIEAALEAREPIYLDYREYLETDLLVPALTITRMSVNGGVFRSGGLGIEARYMDILNERFPRVLYTLQNAPGLRHMA